MNAESEDRASVMFDRLTDKIVEQEDEIRRLKALAMKADSMLSLLRFRGGIKFGGPLPESYEVDKVIGELRAAS